MFYTIKHSDAVMFTVHRYVLRAFVILMLVLMLFSLQKYAAHCQKSGQSLWVSSPHVVLCPLLRTFMPVSLICTSSGCRDIMHIICNQHVCRLVAHPRYAPLPGRKPMHDGGGNRHSLLLLLLPPTHSAPRMV